MLELIWLIPLLPAAGVLINALAGRRLSLRAVGLVACAAVGLALVVSIGAVAELASRPAEARTFETALATWIPLGTVAGHTLSVDWGFRLDPLSAVLLLVVTGVGFLIHVYSVGYMAHEPDYARFFVYLNLFMMMMLILVLADNLLVLFVGWEGVGLCSYLLIGFFYDRPFDERTGLSCADAGRKAFLVNRIGDFAFLIGMLWICARVRDAAILRNRRGDPCGARQRRAVDRDRDPAVPRRVRQVGADPALRLAARRDGRSDARVGVDPRRDDGHRRRVHGVPDVGAVQRGARGDGGRGRGRHV